MQYLPDHDPVVARIIRQEELRIENTLILLRLRTTLPGLFLKPREPFLVPKQRKGIRAAAFMRVVFVLMSWKAWQLQEQSVYSVRITQTFNLTAVFRPTWRFISRYLRLVTES